MTNRGRSLLQHTLAALLAIVAGCGEVDIWSPFDATELVAPDVSAVPDTPVDPLYCNDVADCPFIADCCVTAMCVSNRCGWDVRPACCTEEGPCAATALHRQGQCTRTCEAWGCVESLRLPEAACGGDALATWERWPWDDMVAAYELRGVRGGLQWQLDERVPWAGGPSIVLADAACARLQNRDAAVACDATDGDIEGFRAEVWFPPVLLPEGNTAVVQGFWHDGRANAPFLDATARPTVRMEMINAAGAIRVIWSSEGGAAAPGSSRWLPFVGEITHPAAGLVRIRLVAEATAGTARPDRHFAFAAFQVRQPCASERVAPATVLSCGSAVAAPIHGLADALKVWVADDPAIGCRPCRNHGDCLRTGRCAVWQCADDDHCAVQQQTFDDDVACCAFPAADDAGAAISVEREAWVGDDVWVRGAEPAGGDAVTLHFPLEAAAGVPAGQIDSPPFATAGPNPVLHLRVFIATEWDLVPAPPTELDVDRLTISLIPEPFPGDASRQPVAVEVWNSSAIGGTTRGAWMPITIPLPVAAGARFRVRLAFDAGDTDFNDFEGIHIALLRPGTRCRACVSIDTCLPDDLEPDANETVGAPIPPD